MDDRITLKWTISGPGWAQLAISVDESVAIFEASHLSDALLNFVEAVAAALGGLDSVATFDGEPGQIRLTFEPVGQNVRLKTAEFSETFSRQKLTSTVQTTLGLCTKLRLARAVFSAFEDLLRTHDAAGYRNLWGFDFPESAIAELRSQFVKLKQANL